MKLMTGCKRAMMRMGMGLICGLGYVMTGSGVMATDMAPTPRARLVHFLTGQYPSEPTHVSRAENSDRKTSATDLKADRPMAPSVEILRAQKGKTVGQDMGSEGADPQNPNTVETHPIAAVSPNAPAQDASQHMPPALPALRGTIKTANMPDVPVRPDIADEDETGPDPEKSSVKIEALMTPSETDQDIATFADRVVASQRRPFYLSAADYLALRQGQDGPHMQVNYVRQASNAKTGIKTRRDEVTVMIGPDYAAIKTEDETRIYDFLHDRRLTLTQTDTGPIFHSTSLYPLVLKKVDMVTRATRKGRLDRVKFSPEVTLDRFWLESAMGYAVGPTSQAFDMTVAQDHIQARYRDKPVGHVAYGQTDFPSPQHAANFAVLLRYEISVHPQMWDAMRQAPKLPRQMTVLSYAPKFPSGIQTLWTQDGKITDNGVFPLPRLARASVTGSDASPLAFAISEAAHGRALDGVVSIDGLAHKAKIALTSGDKILAWSYIQQAIEQGGGCETYALCEDEKNIWAQLMADKDWGQIAQALRSAKTETARIKALKLLQPVLELGETPAYIFRRAGELRARIKARSAQAAGLEALTALSLLETALVKDPYDPYSYRELAKVYAAQGRYAESWDMQDALAVLNNAPDILSRPVVKTEAKLRQQASDFFP